MESHTTHVPNHQPDGYYGDYHKSFDPKTTEGRFFLERVVLRAHRSNGVCNIKVFKLGGFWKNCIHVYPQVTTVMAVYHL